MALTIMANEECRFPLPAWAVVHKDLPAQILGASARNIIAEHLNPETLFTAESGLKQNWEGLAELCNFSYLQIRNFKERSNPTCEVLHNWGHRKGSTIGRLFEYLIELEFDALLEQKKFRCAVERSISKYHEESEMIYQREMTPPTPSLSCYHPEMDHDPFRNIDVHEVLTGKQTIYDAFVSFNEEVEEDRDFVRTLVEKLEGVHKLKLCITLRDLILGTAENEVTAKMIKDRCRRVILVLSKDFMMSPQCDFQLKFAQHLSPGCRSKKLIPVMVHQIKVPNILSFVTRVDFVKKDLRDWNWSRLAASVAAPITLTPEEDRDQGDLTLIRLNVDMSESSTDDFTSSGSSFSPVQTSCSPLKPSQSPSSSLQFGPILSSNSPSSSGQIPVLPHSSSSGKLSSPDSSGPVPVPPSPSSSPTKQGPSGSSFSNSNELPINGKLRQTKCEHTKKKSSSCSKVNGQDSLEGASCIPMQQLKGPPYDAVQVAQEAVDFKGSASSLGSETLEETYVMVSSESSVQKNKLQRSKEKKRIALKFKDFFK